MQLTAGQERALNQLLEWWKYKYKPTFEISGSAGTGKTTLVRYLIEGIGLSMDEVLFVAYVGKAALALEKHGLPAKTIHSAICEIMQVPILDKSGKPITKDDGSVAMKPKFRKKRSLGDNIKLIVVDEGPMVPQDLAEWLLSYNIPTIVLGDLKQLPPVKGASYFLRHPDVVLEEIMRQGKESFIPTLASKIFEGITLCEGEYGDGKVHIVNRDRYESKLLLDADIVICGKNKTRQLMNHYMRTELLGITSKDPIEGDKIICRKNSWDTKSINGNVPLLNGMIGRVSYVHNIMTTNRCIPIDFIPEDFPDDEFDNVEVDRKYFLSDKDAKDAKSLVLYEYFEVGHCITCHLAQGSQYNNVTIYYEPMGRTNRNQRQWLYTAVTRAIDEVTILL